MVRTHVAVFNPVAFIGGAEISLLETLRFLPDDIHVSLVLPGAGPLADAARSLGAKIHELPVPSRLHTLGERDKRSVFAKALSAGPAIARVAWYLRQWVRSNRVDVLMTNGIKPHVLGGLSGPAAPMLWYLRESLENRPVGTAALAATSWRCSGVIAISRYVAGQLDRPLFARVPKWVIYNPVDLSRFHPSTPPASDLQRASQNVRYAVVGALTPIKGQDLFLRAAKEVLKENPDSHFYVIGDNPYATEQESSYPGELRALVRDLGIERSVFFLGHRQDAAAVIAAMDVIVQPNRGPEGLGRSVLEAMATAKAVVVVNRWGPGEVVRDDATGLVFPHLDVVRLAEAMARVADAGLRERLGLRARQWAELHVDAARNAEAVAVAMRTVASRA